MTLGEFDHEAQAFGLATPLGINSTTGVAGLTLGGGFGWLSRRLGLSIDNLLSADVVTADRRHGEGERDGQPGSLLGDPRWRRELRGGDLLRVPAAQQSAPRCCRASSSIPWRQPGRCSTSIATSVKHAPEEFVCWFVLRKAPPVPFVPVEWHGKEILALAVCHSGSVEEGERVAAPLREFREPLVDLVAPHPYTAWQAILDPLLAPGMRNYWKSHDFRELSDGLIDVLVDYAHRIPDPQTEIAFAQLGGAVSRVPSEATAYGHRDAQFVMNVHGRWEDPAKDAACIGWARELFQAAAPFATGAVYVNFMTAGRTGSGPGGLRRELRRGWSSSRPGTIPTNLFRLNQNILPATKP